MTILLVWMPGGDTPEALFRGLFYRRSGRRHGSTSYSPREAASESFYPELSAPAPTDVAIVVWVAQRDWPFPAEVRAASDEEVGEIMVECLKDGIVPSFPSIESIGRLL